MNMLILFVFWLGIPAFSLALAIFLGRRFCASARKIPVLQPISNNLPEGAYFIKVRSTRRAVPLRSYLSDK